MISSINDIYRKEIYDKNTSRTIIKYISNLDDKSREYVFKLMTSDWYKCNYILGNIDLLKILDNGVDNFIELCEDNPEFLLSIYKNSNDFYKSTLISKIIVIQKLEEDLKDKILCNINMLHVLDKTVYKFSYNLETFNDYYLDYKDKVKYNKEFIYEYLTDKIKDLFVTNINMYTEYILIFMREYYKWNFYKNCALNRDSNFKNQKEYLQIIKDCPINILINLSISDDEFLKTLIKEYLYNENFNKGQEKMEAKQFLIRNTSEEFQKKLKIIKD